MDSQTNVQVVAVATLVVTVTLWLLGYFLPDLLKAAPPGVESILTGGFAVIVGWLLPAHAFQQRQD
jgi:hypothetical protein